MGKRVNSSSISKKDIYKSKKQKSSKKEIMLGYYKNYAILALNCILKNLEENNINIGNLEKR